MRINNLFSWMVKEYYSRQSPEEIYDELASKNKYESSINYSKRVTDLNKTLSQLKTKYFSILDLACGTGALIDALPWKKSAKIIGLDISGQMLKIAKERFKSYPNITFQKSSFMDLSFPRSSFDLITNAYATRFIPEDREHEFARNVSNLLKPRGSLIVFSGGSFRWSSMLFSKLGFGPRAYNLKLNYHQYFIKAFSDYFEVERMIKVPKVPFIHSDVMIVFKERGEN